MNDGTPIQAAAKRNLFLRTLADLPELLRRLWVELLRQGPKVALYFLIDHAARLATGAPPHHYSRVTAHVDVGGQYSAHGWRRLQARGISAVINLRDEFDDAEAGIAPASYLHLPTVDNTPPTLDDLCRGIRFIEQERARGGRVYVHCMLGVGRSATLVAAYLVAKGHSPAQAWSTIRRARPFVQPTAGQVAIVERFAGEWPNCAGITGREAV
jgi:hypothetical protein